MRYTTDGTNPTHDVGTLIDGPLGSARITDSPTTLKAVGVIGANTSAITSHVYTHEIAPPAFIPPPGEFETFPVPVTLLCPNPEIGMHIHWTDDGSIPTYDHGNNIPGTHGVVSVEVPGTTLKAVSIVGTLVSPVVSGTYVLHTGEPPPPPPPFPPPIALISGGLRYRDAAPLICGVVDNGVCSDDPRVLKRLNEATKMVLDYMIPVGGQATYDILTTAVNGTNVTTLPIQNDPVIRDSVVLLPPELENAIEVVVMGTASVRGNTDITEGWYEIVNNSTYLDPAQQHDNPLVDAGLVQDDRNPDLLRRKYIYPGLAPGATVRVTGAKRYLPITENDDYLIVQNIEALKLLILSIERNENAAPDEAPKYRQQSFELLQAEVKKHLMDPRNYMRRKSEYQNDVVNFSENTLGWTRANIALDLDAALRTGKSDLTWSINQIERRMMQNAHYKDTIVLLRAEVVGGEVYFPLNVGSVLAVDLNGGPIPIRSEFFEYMDNGPGMFATHPMLVDQGEVFFEGSKKFRRKYKLVADCDNGQCLSAVCKLRWIPKKPEDMMVIKNYEATRLMMTAKFLEEQEKWQDAVANQRQAFALLDKELQDYLAGIRHTLHVQTYGFGLGDLRQGTL
jgi:hypothetical protein